MSCCAGIVLYNPDIERLGKNVEAILPQVEAVILVDNASANISEIITKFGSIENVKLVRNETNRGVAAALNQILDYADKIECDWALTLDQDSICCESIIQVYVKCITEKNSPAMICPYVIDINTDSLEDYLKLDLPEYLSVTKCITSGCLTNVNDALAVGGFNEALFIDHVDHDLCIRLRIAGYDIVQANRAYIFHEIGQKRILYILPSLGRVTGIKWFTRPKQITNHSPLRVYYYTRNSLYLARKYRGFIRNIPKHGIQFLRGMLLKLIVEENRAKKLAAFLKGCIDGLRMDIK